MGLKTLDKPDSIRFVVKSKEMTDIGLTADESMGYALIITLEQLYTEGLENQNVTFVQTPDLTEAGVAVQPYGAIIINTFAPTFGDYSTPPLYIEFSDGTLYTATKTLGDLVSGDAGTSVTFNETGLS